MTGPGAAEVCACVHCGAATRWGADPSPDLCDGCRLAGRLSPQWTVQHEARHVAFLVRLAEARQRFETRYGA